MSAAATQLNEVSASEARKCSELEALREHLLGIPESSVCEPRVRVALALREALELLSIVQTPRVRLKLAATGLGAEPVVALEPAIEALRQAQTDAIAARCPDVDFAEALNGGLDLRDEMVAACHWNLRRREIGAALVRITDSTDATELSLDLRELADLVGRHLADFETDCTFDPARSVRSALALAEELTATQDRPVPIELLELRDRAFTHLVDLMDEVRQAGRYAFRGMTEARSLFASDLQLRRRRSPLSSLMRSLAG